MHYGRSPRSRQDRQFAREDDHEHAPLAARGNRAGCAGRACGRAAVSEQADHAGRALRTRRQRRHQHAHPAGRHRRCAGPAGHHREPRRGRRPDRGRLCRALRAGRPHAVRRLERLDPARADDDAEAALPLGAGVRAGEHACGRDQHAAGAPDLAGEDRGGVRRTRKEQSRQAHSRGVERRQHQSFHGRAAEAPHRRDLDRGELSRQRPGDRRPGRRPCRRRPPAARRLARAHQGRAAARARGAGAEARTRDPRYPDYRRGGPAGRLRHHLQRRIRAEGHAARRGRQAQRRDPHGAAKARRGREARRARLRGARQHARRVRGLPHGGNRQVD
jgi:hypothetical protein